MLHIFIFSVPLNIWNGDHISFCEGNGVMLRPALYWCNTTYKGLQWYSLSIFVRCGGNIPPDVLYITDTPLRHSIFVLGIKYCICGSLWVIPVGEIIYPGILPEYTIFSMVVLKFIYFSHLQSTQMLVFLLMYPQPSLVVEDRSNSNNRKYPQIIWHGIIL